MTNWPALIALSVAAAAGLLWLHAPAALLLGPLLAAVVFAARGQAPRLAPSLTFAGQGVVGCLIAKMVPLSVLVEFKDHWFAFGMGVAAFLVATTGHDPLTAYLATSPGGADSVAIIAASTDVNQAFVMAMQTVRLLAVLVLAPVVTRFMAARLETGRRGTDGAGPTVERRG